MKQDDNQQSSFPLRAIKKIKDLIEIIQISGFTGLLKLLKYSTNLRKNARNFIVMNCLLALEKCDLNKWFLTDTGLDVYSLKNIDVSTLSTICEFLYEVNYLDTQSPGIYKAKNNKQFEALLQSMYACFAYHEPGQTMHKLLKKEYAYGKDVVRDDKYDAIASATLTSIFSFGLSKKVLDKVEARNLMDLGSGTGEYLAFLEKEHFPGHLIGMDISEGAIAQGKERGYETEKTKLFVGDIFDLQHQLQKVNIHSIDIFSFMFVLHEFEDEQIKRILTHIKDHYPHSRILLTEITNQTSAETKKVNRTVFPELKFVHQLSKQILRTPSEWIRIFSEANFKVTIRTTNKLTNQMCYLFAQK